MTKHQAARLAAAGAASIAALLSGTPAAAEDTPMIENAISQLAATSEAANAALLRGDVDTYLGLIELADDFTLMSPFGGKPSKGSYTRQRWEELGRFFRNGSLKQEVVQAYGGRDLVVLALIEHGHGEVGGLPAQDWPLRVTLVYRRDGEQWRLVHRHADPLVRGISLEQSAALARGSKP